MFTSFDKALVALVMAALSILNLKFGVDLGLSEATVTAIIAGLTPILVFLWPNKNPSV